MLSTFLVNISISVLFKLPCIPHRNFCVLFVMLPLEKIIFFSWHLNCLQMRQSINQHVSSPLPVIVVSGYLLFPPQYWRCYTVHTSTWPLFVAMQRRKTLLFLCSYIFALSLINTMHTSIRPFCAAWDSAVAVFFRFWFALALFQVIQYTQQH